MQNSKIFQYFSNEHDTFVVPTYESIRSTLCKLTNTPNTLFYSMNSKPKKRITKIPFFLEVKWTLNMCNVCIVVQNFGGTTQRIMYAVLALIKMECYWISSNASSIETKRSNGVSAMKWISEFMTEPMSFNQHRSLSPQQKVSATLLQCNDDELQFILLSTNKFYSRHAYSFCSVLHFG